MKKIIFISWASGVWKTSLIEGLKGKYKNKNWEFLHFDDIWIPEFEDMIKIYWSPEKFQKETTNTWIEKMINNYNDKDLIIFEWQVNLQFIIDWFTEKNFTDYEIILIHCDEKNMEERLVKFRNQSELFNENMVNWLNFLKKQAEKLDVKIVDTSSISKEKVINLFEEKIINKYL